MYNVRLRVCVCVCERSLGDAHGCRDLVARIPRVEDPHGDLAGSLVAGDPTDGVTKDGGTYGRVREEGGEASISACVMTAARYRRPDGDETDRNS